MQKVISHGGYTFYNPCYFFEKQDGQAIYVEGTVTAWMGNRTPIPRYNYNQMMYKLELGDPKLILPVPVYELARRAGYVTRQDLPADHKGPLLPAFFAPDRPRPDTIAIYRHIDGGSTRLSTQPMPGSRLAFYAESATAAKHSPWTLPLHEYRHPTNGTCRYSVKTDLGPALQRSANPICHVWENPSIVNFYDADYDR